MTRFVSKNLLFVLLVATSAQAAGITTADVRVHITGKGCEKLNDVYLVINGDDLDARWVKLNPDKDEGSCHWETNLGERGTISTSIASFSLRAGMMRSGCQRAGADEVRLRASIEFAYSGEGTFRNVKVKIAPPMIASYVRYVHPFAEDRNPIPCREIATFARGQGAISSTKFDDEDVFLHLGAFNPKRQPVGLLLNKVVVDDGTLVLTQDGVVYRMTVQRAKGQMRNAPALSSNAISLDIKILGDLKFERAEFQVIK